MIVNQQYAKTWFEQLPKCQQYPTAHPDLVALECAELGNAHQPVFFLYQEGNQFLYLPGIEYKSLELSDFSSPRGYSGIISSSPFPQSGWKLFLETAQARNWLCGFIRNTPLLANHNQITGTVMFDRHTVATELSPDVIDKLETRARTAMRKALKSGLVIEVAETTEQWLAFLDLYSERMEALNAAPEYRYQQNYFLGLADSPLAQLHLCYRNGNIVAGAIFLTSGEYVEYHLSASNAEGMHYSATQLVLGNGTSYFQRLGYHWLHLGGGITTASDDRLLFFKQGFATRMCDFHITKMVFDTPRYEALKALYTAQGKPTNRVIFYR